MSWFEWTVLALRNVVSQERRLYSLAGESRRYRQAWLCARARASARLGEVRRLSESVDFWRSKVDEGAKERAAVVAAHDEEVRRLSTALDQRIVPMPATPVPSGADRVNARRLQDECDRLRLVNEDLRRANARLAVRVDELEAKYEGNPS